MRNESLRTPVIKLKGPGEMFCRSSTLLRRSDARSCLLPERELITGSLMWRMTHPFKSISASRFFSVFGVNYEAVRSELCEYPKDANVCDHLEHDSFFKSFFGRRTHGTYQNGRPSWL